MGVMNVCSDPEGDGPDILLVPPTGSTETREIDDRPYGLLN